MHAGHGQTGSRYHFRDRAVCAVAERRRASAASQRAFRLYADSPPPSETLWDIG